MLEREKLAKEAMAQRFNDALARLNTERSVAAYLHEMHRDGAAKRAEENIERMERTLRKFGSEL